MENLWVMACRSSGSLRRAGPELGALRHDGCSGGRLALGLLLGGAERLAPLAPVSVDRDRLQPELPGLHVGVGDLVHAGVGGHVDGLGDRARTGRAVTAAIMLEVAHVVDRALAVLHRGKAQSKMERCSSLRPGRTLDHLLLVDVAS